MEKKPYYITTAIAYTSGKPHIGNLYEIVLSDAIARYMRFAGRDVYFQTGSDEHGQKIQLKAEEQGITPKQFVDEIAAEIRRNWDVMNISYDRFIRTTDPEHEKVVQKIFRKLYEQGDIYKGEYEGMYCTPCESFFTESQLVDGKCPDCGREVSYAKEEAYFFKLSNYQERLEKYILEHPDFIQPESRKNEMLNNFIRPGLKDLCVSRTSFSWGIPVDFDPAHVIYVWIDALSNYITFPGYDPDNGGSDNFRKYWPADVHVIGKDILRFHTIYWPIMLMALGLPLPKKVFGHPWLIVGDGKMSKSKGNVIYADDLVNEFGCDAVRFYLLKEMPFAQDGALTTELLIERINGELVNILGNLVNRTMAMTNQYFGGTVPQGYYDEAADREIISMASSLTGEVTAKMEELKVADAMQLIFNVLRRSNKYIDETQPWLLAKDESQKARLGGIMYNLLETIRICGVLLRPFIPETGEKILSMLNTDKCSYEDNTSFGALQVGTVLGETEKLFERIDAAKKLAELDKKKTQQAKPQEKSAPADEKEEESVTIDDFGKIRLVTGKILEAEAHPDADKLLVLKVDTGDRVRTIVSGIAKHFKPEELIGRNVTVVANLKPAKLRGILSEGMLLMAEDGDRLTFIAPENDTAPGSSIR
ncbi:MAG: methionine--tRNA ligase [Eubacteriaceae bacterium]|nr:methionine--tRNA ligase [Eubacteriaceae bacterium]